MSAQRRLTEEELDEQIRMGIKRELAAYYHDGQPRTKKIDDCHEDLREITKQIIVQEGMKNRMVRFLQCMTPAERKKYMPAAKQMLLKAKP